MRKTSTFVLISILVVSAFTATVSAQSQYEIPVWVKGVANFWAEDKISDNEFGEGLSFLIDNGIIKVPLIETLQNKINLLEIENSELHSKLNVPALDPALLTQELQNEIDKLIVENSELHSQSNILIQELENKINILKIENLKLYHQLNNPISILAPVSTFEIKIGDSEMDCMSITEKCYTPNSLTVNLGDIIKMTNNYEDRIHFFTSGYVYDGIGIPDGIFDSGLLSFGESFEYTTITRGEIPFYCPLNLWMQGILIVE